MWKWHILKNGYIDNNCSDIYKYIDIGFFPNLDKKFMHQLISSINISRQIRNYHPSYKNNITILDLNDQPNPSIQIFTDGSKCNDKVGSSFIVRDCNTNDFTHHASFRLAGQCTITQAEQYAIYKALNFINKNKIKNRHIRICTDSQTAIKKVHNHSGSISELIYDEINKSYNNLIAFSWVRGHTGVEGNERADSLAKQAAASSATVCYSEMSDTSVKSVIHNTAIQLWQQEWENNNTGRTTYLFFPDILSRLNNKFFHTDYYITQITTGHGNLRQYLHHFKHSDQPFCDCDDNSIQDITHFIFHCPNFDNFRVNLERTVLIKGHNWPCQLNKLVEDKDIFSALEDFIMITKALEPSYH
ncbi:uncharacterized protein [Centruroides vittatus]|uniref:uncharacterized protein n=1 Tax=Centruroides vittatus TaxID=120091 RepID=UPI00350EC531